MSFTMWGTRGGAVGFGGRGAVTRWLPWGSVLAALLRRSILRILPQNVHLVDASGNRLAELHTDFNLSTV